MPSGSEVPDWSGVPEGWVVPECNKFGVLERLVFVETSIKTGSSGDGERKEEEEED